VPRLAPLGGTVFSRLGRRDRPSHRSWRVSRSGDRDGRRRGLECVPNDAPRGRPGDAGGGERSEAPAAGAPRYQSGKCGGLAEAAGVGPALAREIVAYREARGPFRRLEELREVPGIGPKRYARLQGWVRVAETP